MAVGLETESRPHAARPTRSRSDRPAGAGSRYGSPGHSMQIPPHSPLQPAPQCPPLTTDTPPTWPFSQAEHASRDHPRRFAAESAPTGHSGIPCTHPRAQPPMTPGRQAVRTNGPIHGGWLPPPSDRPSSPLPTRLSIAPVQSAPPVPLQRQVRSIAASFGPKSPFLTPASGRHRARDQPASCVDTPACTSPFPSRGRGSLCRTLPKPCADRRHR